MSNRRTRLNDLTRILRTQRALGLAPEHVGYASIEVIPADEPLETTIARDSFVCSECGHRRLNAVQASACCTMQGDDCPECAKAMNGAELAALASVVGSKRTAAIKAAQEMADFMGESFAVWEASGERFRTLRADEWPDGSEWGLIATVNPQ